MHRAPARPPAGRRRSTGAGWGLPGLQGARRPGHVVLQTSNCCTNTLWRLMTRGRCISKCLHQTGCMFRDSLGASSWNSTLFQQSSKLPLGVRDLRHRSGTPESPRQVRARRKARPDPGPSAQERAQAQGATAPPASKMGLPSKYIAQRLRLLEDIEGSKGRQYTG